MKKKLSAGLALGVVLLFSACDGDDLFIPVKDITNLPFRASTGQNLSLSQAQVEPTNATNRQITWNITQEETPGAEIHNATLVIPQSYQGKQLTLTATVVNGFSKTADYSKDFYVYVNPGFEAVTAIIAEIPERADLGTVITLSGKVEPPTATHRDLRWSANNPAMAELSGDANNSTLTIKNGGKVTVTATIAQGKSETQDFVKPFTITVNNGAITLIPPGPITAYEPTLTVSSPEPLNGYTTSFDFIVSPMDYTSYQWVLDGMEEEADGCFFTVPVTRLTKGKHSIMVIAVKNGKTYSATKDFRVDI